MLGRNQAWCCTVCGYVHRGAEPPEACPVCGAPRELFERQAESPSPAVEPAVNQWRCLVCGYVHAGLQPPTECPACGARADCFEPVSDTAKSATRAAKAFRAVIVGAGIAGITAAESLRAASPTAEITVVSKEPELPYYRLNLTRYLAGEIGEEDLPIHTASWYEERRSDSCWGQRHRRSIREITSSTCTAVRSCPSISCCWRPVPTHLSRLWRERIEKG